MDKFYFSDLPEGFRIGTEEHLSLILLTMAQAFADYEYPVPTKEVSHSARLRFNYDLLSFVTKNAFEYGVVLTNEDFSAVMVVVPLEKACDIPLEEIAERMRKYASPEAVENMCAIFRRAEKLEKDLSFKEDTVYIECLAVQTPRQGQKLCSALMHQLFAQCDSQGRDVMLFTNTLRNREIYEHFGFECVLDDYAEELKSYTYFMLHRSNNLSADHTV